MVCMQTRCNEVAEALVAQALQAVALHGGRSQSEREAALRDFRSGSTSILVLWFILLKDLECLLLEMFISILSHILDNSVCEIPKLCRIQAVLLSLLKLSNESNLMLLITISFLLCSLSPSSIHLYSLCHPCLFILVYSLMYHPLVPFNTIYYFFSWKKERKSIVSDVQ